MIPKRIQIHWFWDYLPKWVQKSIDTYRSFFPDWDVCVYREIPDDLPQKYRNVMYEAPHPRYRADLLRWWLLYRDGGIYVDADTIPQKDFSPLLQYNCFFPCLGGTRDFIDIFFVGAEPKMQLFKDALDGCLRWREGPCKGTYFYIGNVLPDATKRADVTILNRKDAFELQDHHAVKYIEEQKTPKAVSPRAYILHFCNFRLRTQPVLRQSLVEEQSETDWLIREFGKPQPYAERPPEPEPNDIAWRKMPNGDLVCDPGGPRPEKTPQGYVQDSEQWFRFHPKPKQSLSDTVQQGEKKRRNCPTCGDNKNK